MSSPMVSTPHSNTSASSGGEYREIQKRKTSSSVIHQEYMTKEPEPETVRYVEVPVVQEVTRHVSKRELVEVEKVVPKYEYEYVEKVVEVPQVQYVDRQVLVPQVQTVERRVTKKEIVDVPLEVVRHIPKVESRVVEKVVEVPGQVVEVPRIVTVENKIPVPKYIDQEVPMVVAQTIKPVIRPSNETVEVDVVEYEPQVVIVDVHVPKPVPTPLIAAGLHEETHRVVTVPAAQYNSMLKMINSHIPESDQGNVLPFITDATGGVPMLEGQPLSYAEPIGDKLSPHVRHRSATSSALSHSVLAGSRISRSPHNNSRPLTARSTSHKA